MKEGNFPVRYLDVPLISARLSSVDCGVLVERINGRMNSWLSKNISSVGRLQLFSSVLYSLQVYWTYIFILPKHTIKFIDQKFNRFLWNRKDVKAAKAKMAWSKIYVPKKEGGLQWRSQDIHP